MTYSEQRDRIEGIPARHWHRMDDGRLQCDLCPRYCRLHEGQRGLCFVRARQGEQLVLTTYGRSSGFCIDPIEKKPLHHFLPGTAVLSFGTAGCNLACKFCQNWDLTRARDFDRVQSPAGPEDIARTAADSGSRSVAFTYNDPVIFLEYAVDTATACRERGVHTVAVSAGYVCPAPRSEFFACMDAANIDLKSFNDAFYWKLCGGHLQPVLETLEYLHRETDTWLELTTLLIPGENDSDAELDAMTGWVVEHLGPDVPMHFTAFHPDWKMLEKPATPTATLRRARDIALRNGVHFAYTGNVHDYRGSSTWCPDCGRLLVGRDWYELHDWNLAVDPVGATCRHCQATIPGLFETHPGHWGPRRQSVHVAS